MPVRRGERGAGNFASCLLMIIDLRTVSRSPRRFRFSMVPDQWEAREETEPVLGLGTPVTLEGTVSSKGDTYLLEANMAGRLRLRCDCCLEPYERDVETELRIDLIPPVPVPEETEIELSAEDMAVDFVHGDELDLAAIVREQIFLSLPIKSVCRENCKGLCPRCGANLNKRACGCAGKSGHPAFSKLDELKLGER